MEMEPTDFSNLIDLLYHIAHKAPSGRSFAQIAELMNKPYSTFASELNASETHKFSAGDLLLLMELSGSDDPVHFLAAKRGGVFVRLQKINFAGPVDRTSINAIKEFGELMAVYADALVDKKLSRDEKTSILKEGYESLQAILELLKCVEIMETEE